MVAKDKENALDKLEALAAGGTAIDAKVLIQSLSDMRNDILKVTVGKSEFEKITMQISDLQSRESLPKLDAVQEELTILAQQVSANKKQIDLTLRDKLDASLFDDELENIMNMVSSLTPQSNVAQQLKDQQRERVEKRLAQNSLSDAIKQKVEELESLIIKTAEKQKNLSKAIETLNLQAIKDQISELEQKKADKSQLESINYDSQIAELRYLVENSRTDIRNNADNIEKVSEKVDF